ncbi:trypsin beta-like [Rhynchophorus ferrugineus]|uniref:trypsin beta-like n=1 Tax=Rhynchophorus ferrugineus TaxID=354439 RepID=UPI003FCE0FDA
MTAIIFRIILIGVLVTSCFSGEITKVTPDHFPYQALVEANIESASGALISTKHVITLANYINGSATVTVYLGFRNIPHYAKNLNEIQGQIIKSKEIIIHKNFVNIGGKYINNVAIVVLNRRVQLSSSVRPIDLSTEPPLPGLYANISGWKARVDNPLQYYPVRLHDIDTCIYQYGNSILQTQELCFQKFSSLSLNLVGNPLTNNNRLIGFLTYSLRCVISSTNCNADNAIINLFPYVKWIHTQIGIEVNSLDSGGSSSTREHKMINKILNNDIKQSEELQRLSQLMEVKSSECKTCCSNMSDLQQIVQEMKENYGRVKKDLGAVLLVQNREEKEHNDIITDIKRMNETVHNLLQKLSVISMLPDET